MKKTILIKILATSIIVLLLACSSLPFVHAVIDPDQWDPAVGGGWQMEQVVMTKAEVILGAVMLVGNIIAVIVLAILGVKYMMGSVNEKAEYKKTMVPYLIGVLLLFATNIFVGVIYNWAMSLNT